jgi:hypothetical protein
MPRKVRDSNLETRTARARLKVCHKPYFRLIEPGASILDTANSPAAPVRGLCGGTAGPGATSSRTLRQRMVGWLSRTTIQTPTQPPF